MSRIFDHLGRIALTAVLACAGSLSLAAEPPAGVATEADSSSAAKPISAKESEKAGRRFVRLHRAPDGDALALQTSIVRYEPRDSQAKKLRVDLIGAIHVGEKAYYDALNKAFDEYDVVLYELVARKNELPKPGQRSAHPISALQVLMKNMLALEFQLDRIDYRKKNLVHADLTPAEFSQSMEDRGESLTQMFLRMMGQSIAEQSKDPSGSSDFRMLLAFLSKDRSLRLKRIMAEQLADVTVATSVLDGPDGSTILTERNKRAMEVLQESIGDGHASIGIFYGAAHLPDMEARLHDEFQLKQTGHRWLTAWSLASPPTKNESTDSP